MPFKKYFTLYEDAGLATVELLALTGLHAGELSLKLSTVRDIANAAAWRGVTDGNGVVRTPPNGGWDWDALYRGQLKSPKKYCVSIKWNEELCGILLGCVSKGKSVVSVHYVETPPVVTALSSHVVQVVVTFTAVLADRLGANYMAVYGPNDAMSARLKSDFGFSGENLFGYRSSGNAPLYRSVT